MKKNATVLVVDDETYVRDSLATLLSRRGFTVRTADSVVAALQAESLAGLDAVLTDLRMPGEGGRVLVQRLAEAEPALPVVVLTGHGTVSSAVECVKAGACDYLLKPADPDELALVLDRAIGQSKLRRELRYLRANGDRRGRPVGQSRAWRRVLEWVEVAAPVDSSVLVLGESGTGKEEVARLLHANSRRSKAAFVGVNCAAIPTELFESELFGHRRGAFTGAVNDREGRFRVADGGTLFLDEINSLPQMAQAKLLRVLEEGSFERLGDSRPTRVDVRLVCASNTDLAAEVEAGRFRADLFYRINVVQILVPPLRDRRDDVAVLVEAFLAEIAGRLGKRVDRVHADTMAALLSYDWPGNVRELRNVIERGVLLEKSSRLMPSSLPFGGTSKGDDLNLREVLAVAEREVLERALERAGGVRREAARMLGVDQRNLAYFLKKHGLMDQGKIR